MNIQTNFTLLKVDDKIVGITSSVYMMTEIYGIYGLAVKKRFLDV